MDFAQRGYELAEQNLSSIFNEQEVLGHKDRFYVNI